MLGHMFLLFETKKRKVKKRPDCNKEDKFSQNLDVSHFHCNSKLIIVIFSIQAMIMLKKTKLFLAQISLKLL